MKTATRQEAREKSTPGFLATGARGLAGEEE